MKKFLLFTLALFVGISLMAQTVVRVVPTGGSTDADGSSWDKAVTLDKAISIIQGLSDKTGNQVWLKGGTYAVTAALNIQDVNLYGGFKGDETTLTARNWNTNQTIIDGTTTTGLMGLPSTATSTNVIDGLIFQNGINTASGGALSLLGSASSAQANNVIRVSNCIFRNNNAVGAAIFFKWVTVTIDNCLFLNNESAANGCVFQINGPGTIVNCTIVNNKGNNAFAYATGSGTTVPVKLYNTIIYGNVCSVSVIGLNTTGTVGVNCATDFADAARFQDINGNIVLTSSPFVTESGFSGNAAGGNTFSMISGADYRLAKGSACIDKGTADGVTLPATDLNFATRSIGTIVDMGAYEYSASLGFNTIQNGTSFNARADNGKLTITGVAEGKLIRIFDISGQLIAQKPSENVTIIPLARKGVALVAVGNEITKVIY